MRKNLTILVRLIPAVILTLALGWPKNATALTTSQLFLSNSGSQANIATATVNMTPSGRYIVFDSTASYIVGNDTNNKRDIFVRDVQSGSTVRVSVSSGGAEGNGNSSSPVITNNGRYILYSSNADNLTTITGLGGHPYDAGLYLYDTKTSTTTFIIAGYDTGNGYVTYTPDALSEDGRFVYYDKLAPGTTWHTYILDRSLNTTQEISTAADGTTSGNGHSQATKTSCDGRFSVFHSSSTNLVPSDTNGQYDIFLVDSMGGHTIKNLTVSGNGTSSNPSISCDGNYVFFSSSASNLVTGDTNTRTDAFMYDVAADAIERISVATGGTELSRGGNLAGVASASADGRYIAFTSPVQVGTVDYDQAFLRDRVTNTTQLISKDSSSQPANSYTSVKAMNYNATQIIYISAANNLGISNPNPDWFLYNATSF